jgi:putative DNA primase/helicase
LLTTLFPDAWMTEPLRINLRGLIYKAPKETAASLFAPSVTALHSASYVDALWAWNRDHNRSVYVAPGLRRGPEGKKTGVAGITALWADLDAKDFLHLDGLLSPAQRVEGKRLAWTRLRARLPAPLQPSLVIDSGGGLQCWWLLREAAWVGDDYAVETLEGYLQGLAGELNGDPSVTHLAALMRLPGFANRKYPDGPIATIVEGDLTRRFNPRDFDDYRIDIPPAVPRADDTPATLLGPLTPVLATCAFLQWCKDHPADVREPLWYSMLSNLVRLEGGRAAAHAFSRSHPGYSAQETDAKLDQAFAAPGPTGCQKIQKLGFHGCPVDGHGVHAPAWLAWPEKERRARETAHAEDAAPPMTDDAPEPGSTSDPKDTAPPPTWPTPQPVTTARPSVEPFDVAALMPASFAPWVQDVAERIQCPPDFVAITVMSAAGSVIGRQVVVRPKRYDDWEVVPNLWGLAVGPPGIMKSPAIKEGLRPLRRLIAAEMARYQDAMRDARFIRMKRDAQEERRKKALKAALDQAQGDEQTPEVLRVRDELRAPHEPLPRERPYLTNDATVEKVGVLLNENPNGFLVFRDELAGLIQTMDREGHQNDRAFYEECWNGTGSYRVDRIERGTLYVEAACLSLLGGLQPARLETYLREWERRGLDDGFIQRFQLLVYPDVGTFRRVDRWPESSARETAVAAFRLLDRLDLRHLQAKTDGDHLPWLNFDDAAQGRFDDWYATLQTQLRDETWPVVLRQHFAKYSSLVPALALVDHLVAGGTGSIPASAVTRALRWVPYLASHARRVYATLTDRARGAAATLAQRLSRAAPPFPDPFTLRWVYRHAWTGLTERNDVEPAVQRLVDLGWLREVGVATTDTGGRPTFAFAINPAIRAAGFVSFVSDSPEDFTDHRVGSVSFDSPSGGPLLQNTDGMEWNGELLAPRARVGTLAKNPEVVPQTYCQNCHNPLAACACDGQDLPGWVTGAEPDP